MSDAYLPGVSRRSFLKYVAAGGAAFGLAAISHVYSANRWQLLAKARTPAAVPSITAALRIAVPPSLLGALLSEWMSSGTGLGYLLLTSTTTSDYLSLWSGAVAMTVVAVAIYALTDVGNCFITGGIRGHG